MLDDEHRLQIMKELAIERLRPTLQPDEFTARMFAELHDITPRRAQTLLREAVADGILVMRQNVLVDGHMCNAYRPKRNGKEP